MPNLKALAFVVSAVELYRLVLFQIAEADVIPVSILDWAKDFPVVIIVFGGLYYGLKFIAKYTDDIVNRQQNFNRELHKEYQAEIRDLQATYLAQIKEINETHRAETKDLNSANQKFVNDLILRLQSRQDKIETNNQQVIDQQGQVIANQRELMSLLREIADCIAEQRE